MRSRASEHRPISHAASPCCRGPWPGTILVSPGETEKLVGAADHPLKLLHRRIDVPDSAKKHNPGASTLAFAEN